MESPDVRAALRRIARAPLSKIGVYTPGALASGGGQWMTSEDSGGSLPTPTPLAPSEEARPGTPREDPSEVSRVVAVTVHRLSGQGLMEVMLDRDATIGQLVSRLRAHMTEQEFRLCIERGRLVLLGQHPRSWLLNDAYARFMLTGDVQRTLEADGNLQFTLVFDMPPRGFTLVVG